mmetsp:Transcript_4312/g.11412  ORF Transcript_4312/g.11412 Transcript_4312/m.11412 type:complete len:137 (+) Transcript_4312:440-850(+)
MTSPNEINVVLAVGQPLPCVSQQYVDFSGTHSWGGATSQSNPAESSCPPLYEQPSRTETQQYCIFAGLQRSCQSSAPAWQSKCGASGAGGAKSAATGVVVVCVDEAVTVVEVVSVGKVVVEVVVEEAGAGLKDLGA